MKIFLDVGHGGTDSGAVNGNLIEKEMNLTTALATAETLRKHGCEVKLSRTNDVYLSLTERANMANIWGADYFVSIHYNAGGGDRGEVIHSVVGGAGQKLAVHIGDELKSLGQSTMKIYSKQSTQNAKTDYYTVIARANMPAVIVEGCFIDNAQDRKFADTAEKQQAIGKSIAKGILSFVGIKFETEETEMKEPEMIYNYIDENTAKLAEDCNECLQFLKDKGVLKGNENGELNLDLNMIRIFLVHYRLGLYK